MTEASDPGPQRRARVHDPRLDGRGDRSNSTAATATTLRLALKGVFVSKRGPVGDDTRVGLGLK